MAAKQQELDALRQHTSNLRGELDRLQVERLAPGRITPVEEAVLDDEDGRDWIIRNAAIGTLAALGLGLAVVGIAVLRPRRSSGPLATLELRFLV